MSEDKPEKSENKTLEDDEILEIEEIFTQKKYLMINNTIIII